MNEPRDEHLKNLRRDYLPHRGNLLILLGTVACAIGVLTGLDSMALAVWRVTRSLILSNAILGSAILAHLIGILLAVYVILAARHDLARMREGSIDTKGYELTSKARQRAVYGLVLLLTWLLLALAYVFFW
jgi:hypothetical protein